jgi:high-affinity nickel-transport protein
MVTLLSILGVGFFLGMRHATDADHVVAVSTIVTRQRSVRSAALIGILWGIGHSLTVAVAGAAIVFLGIVVPERLGLSLEFSVALMLIFLGLLNLKGFAKILSSTNNGDSHAHVHSHGDYVHSHSHEHDCEIHDHKESETRKLDARFGSLKFYQALRPVIVGVVHGLAGSAAVALLVLPLIRNPIWAMIYLLVFGAGTIAGMMLITAAIALPITFSAKRAHRIERFLAPIAGLGSIVFGIFMAHEIGFVQGLFKW